MLAVVEETAELMTRVFNKRKKQYRNLPECLMVTKDWKSFSDINSPT